jgi:colicin import membrane protein
VPFGLLLSFLFHAALIGWALFSMRSVSQLTPDTPAIAADIITPSEFLRLKRGSEDAKNLETKAKDEPKPDDSKNDTAKPSNAPPPPPPPAEQEVAKLEPPPAAEPPKAAEPPPKPAPDPIAKKIEEPPPPPEVAPGPTPDEKKLLEQKLEEERQADEAKKKAAEEEKQKAEQEAKKKAEEAERKKKRAEELKKKKQDEAKKKAEAAKKKFDASKIAELLTTAPDDAPPKALLDKDPTKKGQQAAGSSTKTDVTGKEAGTATGTDTVLSAREVDLLKGMLKSQLNGCWRPPGTGGGSDVPVVELHWDMNPDGSIAGEPRVISAPSTTAGQVYTEAALRAVKMCAPFRLPPDKFEGGWKSIDWTFDPREML